MQDKIKLITYPVKFIESDISESLTISTNNSKQSSKDRILKQALKLHSEGNIEEAEKYKELGNSFLGKGDVNLAEEYFKKAIEINDNYAPALTNLGSIELNRGNLKKALLLLLKATECEPDLSASWGNLANCYLQLGKINDAEISCLKALKLNPNLFNSHFLLATILHSQKRFNEAKASLNQAIKLNPNFFQLHLSLGSILKDLGEIKEAERSTRKAIELNPNFANSYSNLGGILKDLGELKAAEKWTRRAIELNQNFAEAHLNLGGILKDLNNLKEAELYTRKAINLNPNYAIAYLNLGSILSELGRLKEAESSMNKVNIINPGLIKNYLNQGLNYQLKEDISKSIDSYKNCLLLASENSGEAIEARVHLTVNNLILGDYDRVRENIIEFEKLIKKRSLEKIKCKVNRKHVSARANYLKNLFPLLVNHDKNDFASTIIHLGESHCLSFSHQIITISSKNYKIIPSIINGGKAWHFAKIKNNMFKSSFKYKIKKNHKANKIFISFGEIDCRKDEGILTYSSKYNKDIKKVCKSTVIRYINYMESNLSKAFKQRYYFGVPAPVLLSSDIDDLDLKRVKLIKLFNTIMKEEVLARDCLFVDNYTLTVNNKGWNNNKYMCDNFHLSPKCLPILLEKHLHKSNI